MQTNSNVTKIGIHQKLLSGCNMSSNFHSTVQCSVSIFMLTLSNKLQFIEDIGVDGQIMDHVTDADLEQDFGIKVRLHRVKIIEGIKKL